jgi:hypothetical protein
LPEPFALTRRELYEQDVRDARLMRAAGLGMETIAFRLCKAQATIRDYLKPGALDKTPARYRRYADRKKAAKLVSSPQGDDHGPEVT